MVVPSLINATNMVPSPAGTAETDRPTASRRPLASADETEEVDVRESPLEVRPPTPDARCVESPLSSLESAITPTSHFFVRSHFAVPKVDAPQYRLTIEGAVHKPLFLTYEEIRSLPRREVVSVIECAGNSRASVRPRAEGVLWRNGAVGAAHWTGASLRHLLERAGVQPSAVEVVLEGADRGTEPGVNKEIGYEMSISLETALHPDTLIVTEMNGEPLSTAHGFPVRVIVPDWYGMASVKWLTRIVVADRPFDGYFRRRAYAYLYEGDMNEAPHRPVTRMRVKSLITRPREGQVLAAGVHSVRGVAWSGHGRIVRVEVSLGAHPDALEEGTWHPATLSGGESPHSWTHFSFDCPMDHPGYYVLRARATDDKGNVQPLQARWNFRGVGANSMHAVPIEVRPPANVRLG